MKFCCMRANELFREDIAACAPDEAIFITRCSRTKYKLFFPIEKRSPL